MFHLGEYFVCADQRAIVGFVEGSELRMGTCLLLLGLGMIGEVLILVVGEGELLFEFEEVCGVVLGEGGFFSFLL